ncbi:MAG: JAB domain-containing protein [Pseudomonadota bacterium]
MADGTDLPCAVEVRTTTLERCRTKPRVLSCRLEPARFSLPPGYTAPLTSPERAALLARVLVGDLARESFLAIYLNAANCPISYDAYTVGGVAAVNVDAGAIIQGAIMVGAPRLITAHNHPSGSTEPSENDLDVWMEISRRARCVGIEHIDDLIVTPDRFYSRHDDISRRYGGIP